MFSTKKNLVAFRCAPQKAVVRPRSGGAKKAGFLFLLTLVAPTSSHTQVCRRDSGGQAFNHPLPGRLKHCDNKYQEMKHFETALVEPAENANGVIHVPADCATMEEAVRRATPGQTILFAEGEHMWRGKIQVEKALHFRGMRDKATGFPSSKLRGRWRIRIPAPQPWDRNPQDLCTLTNLLCQSESGYCVDITLGHVQMHNVRCFCNNGTALAVSNAEVGLHGCILGFPKASASYGAARRTAYIPIICVLMHTLKKVYILCNVYMYRCMFLFVYMHVRIYNLV